MGVLIGIAVALMIGGGIFYNKLRAAVYGVIGVGGSYFATIGIFGLVALLAQLFGGGLTAGESVTEFIVLLVFVLAGVGYLAYVMIVRCQSVMQRVFLPLVAVMIAFGFCWRLLFALLFRVPMGNGAPAKPKFPSTLIDDQGDTWTMQSDSGDHADYSCRKNGNTITVWYTGDYVDLPAGWRAR